MPTYEYRCPEGHEFEQFQKITDEPTAVCPECGAESERLLSAGAGVIFKGSGFYATDYRDDGYKKAAESETKAREDAAGGDDGTGGSDSAGASESTSGAKSSPTAED